MDLRTARQWVDALTSTVTRVASAHDIGLDAAVAVVLAEIARSDQRRFACTLLALETFRRSEAATAEVLAALADRK